MRLLAAAVLSGRVLFSGLGVPGAAISATHEGRTIETVSDDNGDFRLPALEDGAWTIRIEMHGFEPAMREIALPAEGGPLTVTLRMRRYEEIVGRTAPTPSLAVGTPAPGLDFPLDAADPAGVLNGSVNNAAASPFAQPRAIGNNRPREGSLYTGGISVVFGNSAWNARPYSFGASTAPAPDYGDVQAAFNIGGPLKIPGLVRNGPRTFLNYQHGILHSAATQSAVMPTAAERTGVDRVSPQAAALLAYYPVPNLTTAGGANYQTAVLSGTTEELVQLAMTQAATRQTTLSGTFVFHRTDADTSNLFAFTDASRQSSLDVSLALMRRVNTRLQVRATYRFTRSSTTVTPFFANRVNVSADAGIAGNNQDPENWGPPALSFPDVAGLRDADYQRSITTVHAAGGEVQIRHGGHNITAGGDLRATATDVPSQSNPRGTLTFTGEITGSAFGDFLAGIPATSAIGFSEQAARLRGQAPDAYVADDWRVGALTVNLGVRWEYESPLTPLLRPDRRGVEPRLALSWRPLAGSSLVVRASYGVYRNGGVYLPLATLLSQQPPLARTFSVPNTRDAPLSLANPFPPSVPSAPTFTVDADFRAGRAHTWQLSAQRDLPASLTVIAAYIGTAGADVMQASLPNTYPAGAADPCPACPSGFVYVTARGSSLRNAAQFTLRRRLSHGFTATAQYTLAKSTDDAATFSNTAVTPQSLNIAQDWRDPAAERGPSAFDQRHVLSAQAQYSVADWTAAAQLSAGTGMPFTPTAFVTVAGSGVVGVRPRLTGTPPSPSASGSYANPAAYAEPLAGTWGDAGRNSIRGPSQFSLDASLARVFHLRGRLTFEGRLGATNVLNHVTFASIGTVISSPQFGLPTAANPMRRLQATLRLRF
jgi:carboxypeptidase family protein